MSHTYTFAFPAMAGTHLPTPESNVQHFTARMSLLSPKRVRALEGLAEVKTEPHQPERCAHLPLNDDGRRRDGIDFDDDGTGPRSSVRPSTAADRVQSHSPRVRSVLVVVVGIHGHHAELVTAA